MAQVIARRSNVCKQLHMPAQSGSSSMLERMRRGYTRQAYDDLVQHVRELVPGVALSTDIISGPFPSLSCLAIQAMAVCRICCGAWCTVAQATQNTTLVGGCIA